VVQLLINDPETKHHHSSLDKEIYRGFFVSGY